MRKRNILLQFWVNKEEKNAFEQRAIRSGLSRSAYFRHLIKGEIPRDSPPPDYYAMMKQLYHIGTNLNQIAQKAHVLNVIDVQRYDMAVRQFEEAVKAITVAVILPQPMDL